MTTPYSQNPIDLLQTLSIEGPVDVFNQHKFRETAKYPDGADHSPCSGKQAFKRPPYSRRVRRDDAGS